LPEIIDLGMSDEQYLQLIAEGRDPVQEKICEKNLIQAGVPPAEAHQAAPLLKKPRCSTEEEAIVRSVWKRVLAN
jgi:hypothetical protein